jgi:hypothetical protein
MDISLLITLPILGISVATLGTMVGLGGGFILVPILLVIFPDATASTISSISLTVVFLNATSATIGNYKARIIDFKTTGLLAIGAIPAAAVGAILSQSIARSTFDLSMGMMLVLGSIYVVWRGYRASTLAETPTIYPNRIITERSGKIHRFYVNPITSVGLSPLSGFISSFFGIGGGVINVPVMTFILRMPSRVIAPTAMLLLVLTSSSSLITRILTDQYQEGFVPAALLGAGALIGAQFGVYLSSRVNQKLVLVLLAISMALVGLRQIILGL